MSKPIYCSLILLVLCLIYEAHGIRPTVNHEVFKGVRRIPNNIEPNDSSSSSTPAAEADGAVADSAATPESTGTPLSPSSPLRKSFSLNSSLGYDRNGGLDLNSKYLRGKYYEQQPKDMDSDDLNNKRLQNSMSSRFLNNKPLSGPYNRNNQIDMTSDNLNIGKRQNSMTSKVLNNKPLSDPYKRNNQNHNASKDLNTRKIRNRKTSDFIDFPNLTSTKMNPLSRRKVQQIALPPSSNKDDSQRISIGNDNSSMMNLFKIPNGNNMIFKSLRKCCINGDCRILQFEEECSTEYFKNMKTNQQPNNSMFTTSSNGDNGFSDIMSKLMDKNFKLFSDNSVNSLEGDMGDFQETRKPINMQMGSIRYSMIIPSIGSNNGMGSNVNMLEKKTPINYPYSEPINLSEDEANEIRNQVLQKSNLYREKYNLDPFTLDDQMNNCAQDWANQLVKLQIFDHREDNVYGENLYSCQGLNNVGEKAVESWYNEIASFKINDDESRLGSNTSTHHMTQLLWKSSTKLGVGVSKTSNGMYNVVANYDPSGNEIGFFKDNLPKIRKEDIEEAKKRNHAEQRNYKPYYNEYY